MDDIARRQPVALRYLRLSGLAAVQRAALGQAEKIIECRGENIKTISLSVADGKVSVEIGGQK